MTSLSIALCAFLTWPGTKFGTDHPCSAGTYYNNTGNQRFQDCILCTPGSYCVAGSAVPTPCPRGKYSNTEGAVVSHLLSNPHA